MNTSQGPYAAGTADPAGSASALRLEAIVKTFGSFTALDAVDFDLRPGEVHALLGENGAGKSTLMNIAAGVYTPDSGHVSVNSVPVTISGPARARTLGIGMVHQHYKLVRSFTVLENIMLANPGGSYRTAVRRVREKAQSVAATMGFSLPFDSKIEDLSVSDQQRLEILRVLVAGACIVVLDEPTAVLTDAEAQRLFETVRGLAREGRSIVFVTHKLSEAMNHADRITVMRAGKVVATVTPASTDERSLTEMIVGSNVVERMRPSERSGRPALAVSSVKLSDANGTLALDGASFEVRSGEIYGLAGVGGNGQEPLVEVLMGLKPPQSGSIVLDGVGDVTGLSPERMRSFGVSCIPSDRKALALAGSLPVADNFAVSGTLMGKYGSFLLVNRTAMRRDAATATSNFEIAGVRNLKQKAALLSGGNAQKLVIAREFSTAPTVVIAHSPSRGLDIRATAAVHEHLRAARDRGAGVLLISEDLDEVLLLADRIGVMSGGRVVGEFDKPDRQAIGKAMIGHA